MKVAILAGGMGTRLSEETVTKPKPMVEIGGKPILWHIMKIYHHFGFREFVLALGYKGEIIRDFFLNYRHRRSNIEVEVRTGRITIGDGDCEDWKVHLLDTGLGTQTGGRVRRICEYIGNEPFLLTYGDGVIDLNLQRLVDFHTAQKEIATVTAVRPPARFGGLRFNGDRVEQFEEKPRIGEGWINGGFFVLEPEIINYIEGDKTIFERDPLERLAREGHLMAYRHEGFWQCMDTMRDLHLLESMWQSNAAPWKVWSE